MLAKRNILCYHTNMIDKIPKAVVTAYGDLCTKFKIPSWRKNVFMVNTILIIHKLEKRIEFLERQNTKLKKNK